MEKKAHIVLSKFYFRFALRIFRNISRSVQTLRANVNCREFASRQLHEISTVASNERTTKKKVIEDDKSSRPRRDNCYKRLLSHIAAIEIVRLIPGTLCHANDVTEAPLQKLSTRNDK